jgi:hypothetical protein
MIKGLIGRPERRDHGREKYSYEKHDYSMGSTVCRITITEGEDGSITLEEEQACIAYHGLRCSFTGVVFPVADLPEYIP